MSLEASINEKDIKHCLFQIGGLKAPGPDGFPATFFHKYWDICKEDVINLVTKCFTKGCIPDHINQTYISLIPKVPNVTSMSQLRPISLCNTVYKVISKMIVQRLRNLLPKVVSPNQVAFVPSRQIQDNIIIAQEVLHRF